MRIIVGLSGGVDSAVATFLLQQQGYEVEALFMKNWDDDDSAEYCSAEEDLADAQQVADKLNIKLHTISFSHEYWESVFQHFLFEYRSGRTPNPDILCNSEIKFKAFLDYALGLGADAIATGHYAQVKQQGGQYVLLRGVDNNKDQSYFLHLLNQQQLSHALFPLGELEKDEVRKIAQQCGFENHNKKDSTGICFIGERKFKDFLERYIPAQPGDIVTPEGDVIAKHQGLMFHTIGQRKGLNIGGLKEYSDQPWYVVGKQLEKNNLVVAQGKDNRLLYKNSLTTEQPHWISTSPEFPLVCTAKSRYRQQDCSCKVTLQDDGGCLVEFEQPHWAITPGQSIVFYNHQVCMGGAVIV